MSALQMAAVAGKPLVMFCAGHTRAALRELRHSVEHVFDRWTLSRMPSSVAVDVVPSLQPVVAAHRLVRDDRSTTVTRRVPRVLFLLAVASVACRRATPEDRAASGQAQSFRVVPLRELPGGVEVLFGNPENAQPETR